MVNQTMTIKPYTLNNKIRAHHHIYNYSTNVLQFLIPVIRGDNIEGGIEKCLSQWQ